MNSPFDFVFKMSAVERYAIRFLESSGAYITLEQIKAAKVGKAKIVTLLIKLSFQCLARLWIFVWVMTSAI